MNERIKELAIESGLLFQREKLSYEEKKFAELIIRECADIATINAHQWQTPGTYILKHFEVE